VSRPGRPLRIGLVCPYDVDVPGGVREQVLGLARAMAGLGEDVQVLAPRARGAARREVVDGVLVVTAGPALGLPTNGSTARLALDPVSRRRATRWALAGLDVVHVHEPIPPGIGHSVLRRLAADRDLGLPGPAVVATVHVAMSSRPAGRSRSLRSAALHVGGLLRGVDVLSAVSEHARRTLVDHLGRVPLVVPNAVDVASWPRPGPRPAPPVDGGTVVVLGRAEPRKGVDVLLRAWPRVRAERPAARLLVVGPAEGLRVVPGHGVQLLGAVDEAHKRTLMAGADVLVAPHRGGESFGLVLVEALAAGTPVVASDLPAFRAVLAGHGRLVAPGDPTALAAAVLAELAHLGDLGDLATAPAAAALARRARAEQFDTPVVAARWRDLYDTALRLRAGGHALGHELDVALRTRAATAARLAGGPDPTARSAARAASRVVAGPALPVHETWQGRLAEAAAAAADPADAAAQSRLTALLRGTALPGPVRDPLVAGTAGVRDLRALLNDRAARDGTRTVELDDDTAPDEG